MKELIEGFGNQLRHAIEIGKNASLRISKKKIKEVVITGLGGSGIGGTIVSELAAKDCTVPILTNKGYHLPKFVNKHTLVICSSFSGNTEETLEVFHEARKMGAEIICISSGGQLLNLAKEHELNFIQLPSAESPRAMMGYSVTQLFFSLYHYDLISDYFIYDLTKAAGIIDSHQEEIQTEAINIADKLKGKIPIIYACDGYEGMAVRFRQQLNENSKMLAWHAIIPEMNHNELVGWRSRNDKLAVIFLRNISDYSRNQKRIEINNEVVSAYTNTVIEFFSKGDSMIERTFFLINVCDHVSLVLSDMNGVVAEEIDVINKLKGALAKF